MTGDHPTPEEAAQTALRDHADVDLPHLAAKWLADGFDSKALRNLAAIGPGGEAEARRLLPTALVSIGFPVVPTDWPDEEGPWRGFGSRIAWAIREMDAKLSPYAAAQCVLEALEELPGLSESVNGADLERLLRDWDASVEQRSALDDRIRRHLRAIRAKDVPRCAEPPYFDLK